VTYANARARSARSPSRASTRPTACTGEVSWIAPIARALLKAREGDEVALVTPAGVERIEVLEVRYPAPGGGATA
jgi:transcription elongation factor GreB